MKKLIVSLLFLTFLLTCIGMCSCNVTKKNKSITEVKTDSTGVKKTDSVVTHKADSTVTSKEGTDTETEVEIEYSDKDDSSTTIVVIGGDTIKTTGKKPTKVKVKGKVSTFKSESTAVNKSDSAYKSSFDSTKLVQVKKEVVKDKKSKRFPIALIPIFLSLLVLFLIWLRRKK